MKKVLFVCTGNTCRSPMAEYVFNDICKRNNLPFESKSAGVCTITGLPMSENSAAVLQEAGINAEGFVSTSIDEVDLSQTENFAVMSEDHKRILVELFSVDEKKITVMNISDPYGGSLGRYRNCFDEIVLSVKKLAEVLGGQNGD